MSVGGNAQHLARVQRQLGLDAWAVSFEKNAFEYQVDEVLWSPGWGMLRQQLACWRLLFRAWWQYDVIHYNFGKPILLWTYGESKAGGSVIKRAVYAAYTWLGRTIERGLLRNKVIAVTYQGDDARQGDWCTQHYEVSIAHEQIPGYYTAESDAFKRRLIKYFDQYADLIYSLNPDLMHVLPARTQFIPYGHIDLTVVQSPASAVPRASQVPVVVHAPSHQGAKGSRYVQQAVHALQREGLDFEFRLIEHLTHEQAMQQYGTADLVIDQLLAGWYGALSVEVMAQGKPVICFIRQEDLDYIPQDMKDDLPFIQATVSTIRDVLRHVLGLDPQAWRELGAKSRRFVERWHDPLPIAQRIVSDYRHVQSACR